MILVSAVITTHNRESKIVERALKSVIAQTYSNIEVFVVDDSTSDFYDRDNVKNMVERYKNNNVRYIRHKECMGACVARNTGLNEAKGDFIGFLDDDDEWCPNKIEILLKSFVSKDIGLVYCGAIVRNECTGEEKREIFIKTGNVFDDLIKMNFIGSTSFPLLRTDVLRKIGGFDPLQQSAQDYDVWLRIAKNYQIACVNEPLNIYYIHKGEQISKTSAKRINGLERLNDKYKEYLSTHKDAYWIRHIKMVPEYAKNKQYGKALNEWIKAVCKKPLKLKENLRYLYSFFRILFVID